jgi:RNA polymerase-binding transcription factor
LTCVKTPTSRCEIIDAWPGTREGGAMPPLTSIQELELKRELKRQRSERLAAAHENLARARRDHYAVLAGEGPDVGDQASAEQLSGFENTLAQRYAVAIREMDAALMRIEERRYGRCEDCGHDIGFRRLGAQPAATRCVRCQEQHDRLYAREAIATL